MQLTFLAEYLEQFLRIIKYGGKNMGYVDVRIKYNMNENCNYK